MISKVKIGLAVMISAGVIGVLWFPLFAGLPSGDNNVVPREASKWHIGKGAEYSPVMYYTIETSTAKFYAKIEFLLPVNSEKKILVEINDPNTNTKINQTVQVSSAYGFGEVPGDAKPYFKTLDSTIFSLRDYIGLDDKYLVKNAVWGTVFDGAVNKEITIIDHGKVSFGFGSVNAFTISYNTGNKENKFWIVDNLPLPVRAQTYDSEGKMQYSYELTSLTAPLTPGLG